MRSLEAFGSVRFAVYVSQCASRSVHFVVCVSQEADTSLACCALVPPASQACKAGAEGRLARLAACRRRCELLQNNARYQMSRCKRKHTALYSKFETPFTRTNKMQALAPAQVLACPTIFGTLFVTLFKDFFLLF